MSEKNTYLANPAAKFAELRAAGALTVTARPRTASGYGAPKILVESPEDFDFTDATGRRQTVVKDGFLDVTDPESPKAVTARDLERYHKIDARRCESGDAKVMFYNLNKGVRAPGYEGYTMSETACVPVAVLFNENSSAGEVRPLEDVSALCESDGIQEKVSFQAGDNFVLGIADLSARPALGFHGYATEYEDNLLVPLGAENIVHPIAIKATEAIIAATPGVPDMTAEDRDKLFRHLAYGDVMYTGTPYEPLTMDKIKYTAMENLGAVLNRNPKDLELGGELLFELDQAAGGDFSAAELREQYANGGSPLPEIPSAYAEVDGYIRQVMSGFVQDHPAGKHEFAEALASQWAGLDDAFDNGAKKHAASTELAFMHVACRKMGWDLVPDTKDAKALDGLLQDFAKTADKTEFTAMLERSLSAHEQPQAEKGTPGMPKKDGGFARLQGMLAREDEDRGHGGYSGLEM